MKKLFTLFASLICATVVSSGCSAYQSDAGTKDEIIGTYKLTTYEMKDENDERYDYGSIIGATAYFTIDKDGYGYYAYKDKNTALSVTQVFSTFIVDNDEPEKYKAIELTDGLGNTVMAWNKKVGCLDEPIMGFNKNNKTLSYSILEHDYHLSDHHQDYQYVCYTKISEDTTISTINKELETNYSFNKPFELKRMEGLHYCTYYTNTEIPNPNYGKYEYMILDMDSYSNGQLQAYYSLAAEPGKTNIQVPVEFVDVNSTYKTVKITIFGDEYLGFGYSNALPLSVSRSVDSEPDADGTRYQLYSEFFSKDLNNLSLDELIASLMAR